MIKGRSKRKGVGEINKNEERGEDSEIKNWSFCLQKFKM